MNTTTGLLLGLLTSSLMTSAGAQDPKSREDRTPTTGTKILKTIRVNEVFEPSVILLGNALTSVSASAMIEIVPESRHEAATDITFVLDDSLDIAATVFEELPAFRTERVIRTLHSLGDVRDYLASSSETYHTINLVAHGAPQTGLKVGLSNPDERASTNRLIQEQSRHPGLIGKIDASTRIRLYSCGVAADRRLLDAVADYFAAGSAQPSVLALNEFIQFRESPELSVSVKESLTVISPSRMAARRWIEREANKQAINLPSGWEQALDTKPMWLELILDEPADLDTTAIQMAEQSSSIQQELSRLHASTDQFAWTIENGRLTGQAVIAHLPTEPPKSRATLAHPDEADWIASR